MKSISLVLVIAMQVMPVARTQTLEDAIHRSRPRVILADGREAPPAVTVSMQSEGGFRRCTISNGSNEAQALGEVVLFDVEHGLPGDTRMHGESYNMFGGVIGTLDRMVDLDPYTDRGHYRLPEKEGFRTVYGVLTLTPSNGRSSLVGFTSCRRFVGQFRLNLGRLQAAFSTEGLVLEPGASWDLEEWALLSGSDQDELLGRFADRIQVHHPRLPWSKLPTGWCSWYCFGPSVTAADVRKNLAAFKTHLPGAIRFIHIDDGYQPWMGDWLETNEQFQGGLQPLIAEIRRAGFEPAIWVAPFIASPESRLFREHPEWFVRDDAGEPLRSDRVTFGGWRQGPWYMLDGTHPGAQGYLERVFRTMREWGVTYFKMDANIWGALPFGRRHDPQASSVEAYRRGMAAVRRGAGESFLLGCNHALWPSLGEIHGSRSSMDVDRSWEGFVRVARENLWRNWLNNRLWWNDPDCLLLDVKVPENERQFHLAATYATGGMVLSGDDASAYSQTEWEELRRFVAASGRSAVFTDSRLEAGVIPAAEGLLGIMLNWGEAPARRSIPLPRPMRVVDFWTGEDHGVHEREFVVEAQAGRSGRMFKLTAVQADP